jgi:hypothetical protein
MAFEVKQVLQSRKDRYQVRCQLKLPLAQTRINDTPVCGCASGLGRHLDGEDRKIRAEDFTEMAVDALVLFRHLRKSVSLEIECLGHPEDDARAILDT